MTKHKTLLEKTLSRLAAVQAVYLYDINTTKIKDTETNLEKNILEVISQYDYKSFDIEGDHDEDQINGKINKKFMSNIALSVYDNISTIDEHLTNLLNKHEKLDQLSLLLKAILRCATAELLYMSTPKKVVIDEYVKLSKDFFGDAEINFTNAILDNIKKISDERI